MEDSKKLVCFKCRITLTPAKTEFSYLGHRFHVDMLRCPQCGQVFIPEEVVKGRMAEVEMAFESK